MTPEEIVSRMGLYHEHGDIDNHSLQEIRRRIAERAALERTISYSDLVSGITFRHRTFWGGEPHIIDTHNWEGLDRHMIGGVLASLSAESMRDHGFLVGAMVVDRAEQRPSGIFFSWLHEIGVLESHDEDTVMAFWLEHLRRAHQHYRGSGR